MRLTFDQNTRLLFGILMFNTDADKRSATADIADFIAKRKSTVQNEMVKLVKAGLVERHPIKRYGFIIASMKF